jgi:hypothetical protein
MRQHLYQAPPGAKKREIADRSPREPKKNSGEGGGGYLEHLLIIIIINIIIIAGLAAL